MPLGAVNMIEKSPKVSQSVRLLGNLLTDTFHFFALFVIGSMVVWSAGGITAALLLLNGQH